jgi:DNA-binding NtrC family response regulator
MAQLKQTAQIKEQRSQSPSPRQLEERPAHYMTENADPIILLVDDEEMVLNSMKSFFAIETDYRILAYTSPIKALEDLGKHHGVDLVISDYLMPEMDGITFLARVKEKLPMVPRILLTGYADKENAIKAINNVGLYQYIEKPWDNEDLKLIIRNGLEKTTLLHQLEEKLREVERAQKELSQVQKDILRVFA